MWKTPLAEPEINYPPPPALATPEQEPWFTEPELANPEPEVTLRYDTQNDVHLSKWMELDQLKADSVLCISASDIYNAHSVLRKAH